MGLKTAILSNGNNKMLESAVINANIKTLLDEILSVDECKVYKPSSEVYDLVEKKMGVNKQNVLFISSNAWDMHAASNYGFKTIWLNRFNSKCFIIAKIFKCFKFRELMILKKSFKFFYSLLK